MDITDKRPWPEKKKLNITKSVLFFQASPLNPV